jgi:aminoglycoside N3'-acetyltransferase
MMREVEMAPDAGEPWTRVRLVRDLRVLGVADGDTLLVHASLRAMGFVIGGAVTVVRALRDSVGPTGTIVVPTATTDNTDPRRWHLTCKAPRPAREWVLIRDHLPAFDPAVTPSRNMGAVTETVRTWPGAVRSGHPQTSFAALGARAGKLMADHHRDCHYGERSPLARLVEVDAKVLLLGVGYDVCTAFHLAEYLVPDPPVREYECVITDESGERRWYTYQDVDLRDGDFADLGSAFEASEEGILHVRKGGVGDAESTLLSMNNAVEFAADWLSVSRSGAAPSV